jgi:hypothetical protein
VTGTTAAFPKLDYEVGRMRAGARKRESTERFTTRRTNWHV